MVTIGDGRTTKFWTNDWLDNVGPLIAHTVVTLTADQINMYVFDFLDLCFLNRTFLASILPSNVVDVVLSMHPPSQGDRRTFWFEKVPPLASLLYLLLFNFSKLTLIHCSSIIWIPVGMHSGSAKGL